MKKRLLFVILLSILTIFTGCEETSTSIERRKQEELSLAAINSVDLPDIKNFYEKKTLKKILEMRDNPKIINYLYTRNEISGKWVYEGKCIGFGIPYSTQYTNPERASHSSLTLPQADPNGLYSTPNGTATWVIKVDDTGVQTVEYIESEIRVTQTKLRKELVETWSLTKDY